MKEINIKREEQLGMKSGTAANILRKSILFSLIKECGKNYCYQCALEIETVEELSIEHKVPWLDSENPLGLYFNLDNISFNHLSCNIGAARKTKVLENMVYQVIKNINVDVVFV